MAMFAAMVRIEAKTGQEAAVAALLGSARPESATQAWHAFQLGPSTFGLFAAFTDDAGYDAFVEGGSWRPLLERTPELSPGRRAGTSHAAPTA